MLESSEKRRRNERSAQCTWLGDAGGEQVSDKVSARPRGISFLRPDPAEDSDDE